MEAKEGPMLTLKQIEGALLSRVLRDKNILIEILLKALRHLHGILRVKLSYAGSVGGKDVPH